MNTPGNPEDPAFARQREVLLKLLKFEGIKNENVLAALRRVPRHQMVPEAVRSESYLNQPLPLGANQTISQPYIVALMSQLADIREGDRVLEIGTGSGYQAAVLSQLAGEVYTIEIIESLAASAKTNLQGMGLAGNIHFRVGDGATGWPEAAPFDAIVVTAAPEKVPWPLVEQLTVGGRLVIPVGPTDQQELQLFTKQAHGMERRDIIAVRFVPMTGEAQTQR